MKTNIEKVMITAVAAACLVTPILLSAETKHEVPAGAIAVQRMIDMPQRPSCEAKFSSALSSVRAVCGLASNEGNYQNYGGFFEAFGVRGVGVHGYASGDQGIGVFGRSKDGIAGYFASDSGYGLIVAKGSVGIGVLKPTVELDVAGTIKADAFVDGAGESLIGWGLGGNASAVMGTHYLGTNDNQGLDLRVNAQSTLRLEPANDGSQFAPNILAGSGSFIESNAVGATISGGRQGGVSVKYGTVGGGFNNVAGLRAGDEEPLALHIPPPSYATVSGGSGNTARGAYATVGGGVDNQSGKRPVVCSEEGCSYSPYTTVAGGAENVADGMGATIGGGRWNRAAEYMATVSGGTANRATGGVATVGGGSENKAEGDGATIAGGSNNTVDGMHATVPGGVGNSAAAEYSFAAGSFAKIAADHRGSFVYADNYRAGQIRPEFHSQKSNEFAVRATGGFRVVTAVDNAGVAMMTTVIDSAGRIGVGTSMPQDKLDVNGVVRATGYKSATGNIGLTKNISVAAVNGSVCTLIIESGLITATNCPNP